MLTRTFTRTHPHVPHITVPVPNSRIQSSTPFLRCQIIHLEPETSEFSLSLLLMLFFVVVVFIAKANQKSTVGTKDLRSISSGYNFLPSLLPHLVTGKREKTTLVSARTQTLSIDVCSPMSDLSPLQVRLLWSHESSEPKTLKNF